jgi:hypothetical protein
MRATGLQFCTVALSSPNTPGRIDFRENDSSTNTPGPIDFRENDSSTNTPGRIGFCENDPSNNTPGSIDRRADCSSQKWYIKQYARADWSARKWFINQYAQPDWSSLIILFSLFGPIDRQRGGVVARPGASVSSPPANNQLEPTGSPYNMIRHDGHGCLADAAFCPPPNSESN